MTRPASYLLALFALLGLTLNAAPVGAMSHGGGDHGGDRHGGDGHGGDGHGGGHGKAGALRMSPAAPDGPRTARAALIDRQGAEMGTVVLRETLYGVLLELDLEGLPPGAHAFHVHETGICDPPFASAGGHFAPRGMAHGFLSPGGHHAGDMPNIHVLASGALTTEIFNSALALDDALFDADGAAIVIHRGGDDYRSQPAGAAGPRIACGVIER